MLDTNILISAILRDGLTRRLIFLAKEKFLIPTLVLKEIDTHRLALCRKTGLSSKEFLKIFETLLSYVHIVTDDKLRPLKQRSRQIIAHIDLDDAAFIACCLAHSGSVLWSDDKALKEQDVVKVMNTREIIELLTPFE